MSYNSITTIQHGPPALTPRFRLLDLAPEIRLMVLKELFQPIRLELQDRNCQCHDAEGRLMTVEQIRQQVPSVLLVNKLIYSEAIGLYKAWPVSLVTYDILPNDALTRVIAKGFQRVTQMFVDEETVILPERTLLPALQEVIIHLCWDDEYGTADNLDFGVTKENLLENILKRFDATNIAHAIKQAKEEGDLPYRLLTETEYMLCCEHDHCDPVWWQEIRVDVETRDFLYVGNTDPTEHEPGCPGTPEDGDDENGEGAEPANVEDGGVSVAVEGDENKENVEAIAV
ncbi:uncharacterized protein AB675_12069 [Cyphellophora attinorum]|uniref:Uncharacterized protein n=1 Tax=Cyphellophora attinorum TaxID=1664694 RepID=A0A0N1H8V2_9EURO|nr:uncharacterized protein AB675_12069 [Phialophora attinorum]KPI38446.1 hypothetical protein AB675_12069 [Phialophora attinorum]